MSGCERNLTCQSTEVEQQTQVAGINAMLREGRPVLPEIPAVAPGLSHKGNEDAACVLEGGWFGEADGPRLLTQPAISDDASSDQ